MYRSVPTECVASGWERIEKGNLARLAGIEPTTLGFGGQYSIH